MSSKLQNKVALVTGGTSGIGRASAIALAKAGAKVVVSGRRETEGQETVRLIEAVGGEALFVKADVSNEADVINLVNKTVEKFGGLHIAFNNAGVEGHPAPITQVTSEDYQHVFDINVKGVLLSLKHEVPAMLKSGGGSIINTSSVAGLVGMANVSVYVASKHAVIGITKSVALEFAKQNIRVNAVSPAAIQTDMFERFTGGADTDAGKYLASMHPIGRVGVSDEIANPVVFLASDDSSFITGQSLTIDGGFTAQ